MLKKINEIGTGELRRVRFQGPPFHSRRPSWISASSVDRLEKTARRLLKRPGFLPGPRLLPLRAAPVRNAHWLWGGLTVLFLAPVLTAIVYFGMLASDQFVSETRFAVRGTTELLPGSDALGFGGLGRLISLNSNQDVYIVSDYTKSRTIIGDLSKEIDLRSIFNKPGVDWWARLAPSESMEGFVRYWRGMVDSSVEPTSGIVTVKVKAFSPEDSVRLATAIRAKCEIAANQLLDKMRGDAVRVANVELDAAKARLATKQAQLEQFRNTRMQVDPMALAHSLGETATSLRKDLIDIEVKLDTARASLAADAPQIKMLAENRQIVEGQIVAVEAEITSSSQSSPAASTLLRYYDQLEAERTLAERAVVLAESQLDNALSDANRHHIYLVSIEEPTVPQSSLAPERLQMILIVSLIALGAFLLVTMIAANVRDHAI